MLEAEVNFVEDMEEIMTLVEDMLRYLTVGLHDSRIGQELIRYGMRSGFSKEEDEWLKVLESRWQGMIKEKWPRITYTEAINLLLSSSREFVHKPRWGAGLQAEHERYIATTLGEGSPVFVTDYPKSIKPFYMLSSPTDTSQGETVKCFDLLVPEVCEIVGGSMREHRLSELLSNMQQNGMLPPGPIGSNDSLGSLQWYVDLRRWGSVPHGGFGLGFDRLLGYLAGVQNIREMVTFPRWVGRCDC
jgi:asparaginyl-tRNA synthetase